MDDFFQNSEQETIKISAKLLEDFWEGKELYPGAGFVFSDDIWHSSQKELRQALKPSGNCISFVNLVGFIKNSVKAYISWGWLAMDYSLSWCKCNLSSLNHLSRYLNEYRSEITQLIMLDGGVRDGFAIYLVENLSEKQAYNVSCDIKRYIKWVKKQYNLKLDFKPKIVPYYRKEKDLIEKIERVLPYSVIEQLMYAIGEEHKKLWEKWNNSTKSNKPKSTELLYIQILKICILAPLRISQIMLLGRSPYRKSRKGEAPGIWIKFNESKTHQGFQETFIPTNQYAEIVKEALYFSRAYTHEMYKKSKLNYLFLTNKKGGSNGGGFIRNISSNSFTTWLNGKEDKNGNIIRKGFIHRHDIKFEGEYYHISPHQFRHTIATRAYEGNAGFGTIVNHLKHRKEGNMTGTYIHGIKKLHDDVKEMHDNRENFDTLLQDKEVKFDNFVIEDLEYLKANNMYLQPTLYGVCASDQRNLPCENGNPNWLGPKEDPVSINNIDLNLFPDVIDDKEIISKQMDLWKNDSSKRDYIRNIELLMNRYCSLDGLVPNFENQNCRNNYEDREEFYKEFIKKFHEKSKIKKDTAKTLFKKPLSKSPKESIIDGVGTYDRVHSNFKEMVDIGERITLAKLARMSEISESTIKRRFTDITQKIKEINEANSPTFDEISLSEQVQEVIDNAIINNEILTIVDIAKKCGVKRDVFYASFPKIGYNIRKYMEQQESKIENNFTTKVESEIKRIKNTGETIKLSNIAKNLGVGTHFFYERFPKTLELVKGAIEQQKKDWANFPNRLQEIIDEATEHGERITTSAELVKRCGVPMNVLYDHYPHLVALVNNFIRKNRSFVESDKNKTIIETVIKELEIAKQNGEKITVKLIAKRCGIDRKDAYKIPYIIDIIQNAINEQKLPLEAIENKIRNHILIVQREGIKVDSIVEFVGMCGVDRRIIYKRFPNLLQQIRELIGK